MTIEESYSRLQDEHRQLQEDYAHLSMMFENMGKGYEEALNLYDQAMESSRMKTDFIQQISHEIRTPLNILSGCDKGNRRQHGAHHIAGKQDARTGRGWQRQPVGT